MNLFLFFLPCEQEQLISDTLTSDSPWRCCVDEHKDAMKLEEQRCVFFVFSIDFTSNVIVLCKEIDQHHGAEFLTTQCKKGVMGI